MNYNNFSRRKPRRFSIGAVLSVAALAIVIGAALVWRQGAQILVWKALAPIVAVRDTLSASQSSELRAELASTTAALADYYALKQENADLLARLGRPGVEHNRTLAGVLMAPPASAYDTLVIDAGTAQGIAVGQSVSAGGNTVIGTVTDVSSNQAQVTLLSAPGSAHDALIMSKATGATTPISIAGQGGGSFTGQLPAGTQVSTGDSVVFAGIAGQFVATVTAIDAPQGASFINVYLHMPVNIYDLRFVEVIHQ